MSIETMRGCGTASSVKAGDGSEVWEPLPPVGLVAGEAGGGTAEPEHAAATSASATRANPIGAQGACSSCLVGPDMASARAYLHPHALGAPVSMVGSALRGWSASVTRMVQGRGMVSEERGSR